MQRLFIEAMPKPGEEFSPGKEQAHYLLHVLRLQTKRDILLFDGKTGGWRARCIETGKKSLILRVEEQSRPQPAPKLQLVYCFAPLKQARLDYMVQKAVEMGANFLQPVLTQHTQIHRLNYERVKANMIEAAEQCGLLNLAGAAEAMPLAALLQNWQQQWGREARLIFCDEAQIEQDKAAARQNPLPALLELKNRQAADRPDKSKIPAIGLLIGPEGGFSEAERRLLYARDFVAAIPLGPRILRAATAALALIQSTLGDW